MWTDLIAIICALIILTGAGLAIHWWWWDAAWWPWVGVEWRAERWELAPEDAAVVADLHAINLAVHTDRPIHQLTHYELEYHIKQLGIADWLPDRYKAAA